MVTGSENRNEPGEPIPVVSGAKRSGVAVAWLSSGLAMLFGRASHVVSSWVLARCLSPRDFGAFLLLVTTVSMIVGFLSYGLRSLATHFLSGAMSRNQMELNRAFSTIVALATLFVAVALVFLTPATGGSPIP